MYPSSPPSSPPSLASSLSWSREPSPMPLAESGGGAWQHPFAATSRAAGLKPPRYDVSHAYRKLVTPPDTPPRNANASNAGADVEMSDDRQDAAAADDGDDDIVLSDDDELAADQAVYDRQQRDAEIWREAVSNAFDVSDLNIDLTKSSLRNIDRCVQDLGGLVVLGTEPSASSVPSDVGDAFARVDSAATEVSISRVSSHRRLFKRSQTRSHGLELYLGHNEISQLPPQLFTLHQLVVLSLDNNEIVSLPGAIGQLKALKLLNVARNKLTTLPVELDQLRLEQLLVVPNNSFLKPDAPLARLETLEHPSLVELALRVLMAPGFQRLRAELISDFGEELIPPHVMELLEPSDANACAQFNVCAAHGQCFVRPGHTRVEFRTELAGVRLTEPVPVLLRGCAPGCLDAPAARTTDAADEADDFMEGLGERVL